MQSATAWCRLTPPQTHNEPAPQGAKRHGDLHLGQLQARTAAHDLEQTFGLLRRVNQERLELQAEVAALCRGREAGEAAQAALRGRAAELAAVVRDTESANAVLQAELSAKAQVLEELGHKVR